MPNVDFSEGNNFNTTYSPPRSGGLTGFLISHGIAKDERSANLLLLAVAVVGVVAAIFFFLKSGDPRREVTPRELLLTPAFEGI